MLSRLNLKTKLRVSFLILVLFSSILGIVAIYYMSQAYEYNTLLKFVQQYNIHLQQVREAEQNFIQYDRKDAVFLETGESSNRLRIAILYDSLNLINKRLSEQKKFNQLPSGHKLNTIVTHLNQYKTAFEQLADTYKKRGFYNHGLEVEMRNYIHDLQGSPSAEEQVFAYKLRRNEKDFMLRSDEKYLEEFRKNLSGFKKLVSEGKLKHMTTEYRQATLQKIESYEKLFSQLVAYEKQLGLSENEGLKGQLKENLSAVFPPLEEMAAELNHHYERLIRKAYQSLIGGLVILLVIGVALGILLSRIITRPVLQLDAAIIKATQGNYSVAENLEEINKQDEIGRLAGNFLQLITTIKNQFSEIQEKNRSLEISAAEDARRNWANDGVATLSALINQNQHIDKMLDQVLPAMLKYTEGNQGAVFMVNQSDPQHPFLELVSCYAYNRKKYLNKKINLGEGLAGTAWLEKEPILLTEIPKDYIHITSGLGEAPPAFLIIIPLVYNDQVEGVAELAYFHKLQSHEIESLKNVCNRIAVAISTLRIHEKTQQLLNDTQGMTEQLRAQEEEMRQNMEELQATQEEMERKVQAAQQHIQNLSFGLSAFDHWTEEKSEALIVTDTQGYIRFVTKNLRNYVDADNLERNKLRITDVIPDFSPHQSEPLAGKRTYVTLNSNTYRCQLKRDKIDNTPYYIIRMEPIKQHEDAYNLITAGFKPIRN
jgi:methyl-accepting chemotaxis protein